MQWQKRRVHLVLGSGGVRCLSYLGAFKAFAERNIELASVSTCSAGTLMGALLCTPGLTLEDIEQRLIKLDLQTMAGQPRWPKRLRWLSLLKWPFSRYSASAIGQAYENLAERPVVLGELAWQNKPVEFITAAVDIDHDRILVYASSTHATMPVKQAIDIAAAAPTVYPPFVTKGRTLIDALVFSELPVWLAAGLDEALPIIALRQRQPPRRAEASAKNVGQYLVEAFTSAVRSHDYYFVRQLPRVHLVEIDSSEWKSSDRLNEAEKYTLFQRGYDRTADMLDTLRNDWWRTPTPSLLPTYGDDEHKRAEERAAQLITRFQRRLGRMRRERAFISYSRRNRDWLERLKRHLKPHALETPLVIWDDQQIQAGKQWENEIREALAQASVVVLLVSEEFLNSAYVREQEIPEIVRLAEHEGVRLFWIPLDQAGFGQAFLQPFQALTEPLRSLDHATAESQLEHASFRVVRALSSGNETAEDGEQA